MDSPHLYVRKSTDLASQIWHTDIYWTKHESGFITVIFNVVGVVLVLTDYGGRKIAALFFVLFGYWLFCCHYIGSFWKLNSIASFMYLYHYPFILVIVNSSISFSCYRQSKGKKRRIFYDL